MSLPIPTSSLAAKFAQIIEGLRHTVPKFIARDRNAGPLIMLIWSQLGRLGRQFAALAARAEAGTLRTAPRCQPATPRVGSKRAPGGLPTGCAWLGDMMWETRSYGAWLQQMVLEDPEMAALIAACPQVGRIVRSVLWMISRSPVPAILRVSRPKRVVASPRPSKAGLRRREVEGSTPVDGSTPPSVPPTSGGRKEELVPAARGGRTDDWVYSSSGERTRDPAASTKVGIKEVRFWSQPRGKLRSTAGPRRVA